MADIFISYAHQDRARVNKVKDCLNSRGFSTYDFHEDLEGRFDLEADKALRDAPCVVVFWTENSVNSKSVRGEALEADDDEKLVPVLLDPVRPPSRLRTLRYEDLSGWNGACDVEPLQRVSLRAAALVKKGSRVATDHLSQGFVDRTLLAKSAFPSASISGAVRKFEGFPWITLLLLTAMIAVAFLLNALLENVWGGSIFSAALIIAAISFILFRFAEIGAGAQFQALASRWLLPVSDSFRVSVGEAFSLLFSGVYGRRHFTFKCLARSTISSVIFFTIALGALITSGFVDWKEFVSSAQKFAGLGDAANLGSVRALFSALSFASGVILLPNIIADYLALYKTRQFLYWFQNASNRGVLIWTLDVMSTTLIIFFFLTVMLVTVFPSQMSGDWVGGIGNYLQMIWRDTETIEYWRAPEGKEVFISHALLAAFLTTYATSLWLLLTISLGRISRRFLWSQDGATRIGRLMNVEARPITALGLIVSIIIVLLGASMWLAMYVLHNFVQV